MALALLAPAEFTHKAGAAAHELAYRRAEFGGGGARHGQSRNIPICLCARALRRMGIPRLLPHGLRLL